VSGLLRLLRGGAIALGIFLGAEWGARAILTGTARLLSGILNLTGARVVVVDNRVEAPGVAFVIVAECTAILPLALLLGAVWSFPAGFRRRLWFSLWGALALLALNQLRLVGLWHLLKVWPRAFDVAHLQLGQGLMVIAVVLLFLRFAQGAGVKPSIFRQDRIKR
jgi:exosortase/archaeosortase family protein